MTHSVDEQRSQGLASGPDETHTFQIEGRVFDNDLAEASFATAMTAIYVPFGPDGDNTLDFEA